MSRTDYNFRLTEAWKAEIGGFSFSGHTAGLAFRTALASVLSILVAMILHLDNPYWAGITAISITLPDISSSIARSIDRCLGTMIGAAVGYFGAHFVADHVVFQLIIASAVACLHLRGFAVYRGTNTFLGIPVRGTLLMSKWPPALARHCTH